MIEHWQPHSPHSHATKMAPNCWINLHGVIQNSGTVKDSWVNPSVHSNIIWEFPGHLGYHWVTPRSLYAIEHWWWWRLRHNGIDVWPCLAHHYQNVFGRCSVWSMYSDVLYATELACRCTWAVKSGGHFRLHKSCEIQTFTICHFDSFL